MTAELERHNVHTIISAIGLVSNETSQSQLNLIEAAEKSSSTKRFIPSEFSFIQTPEYVRLLLSISIASAHHRQIQAVVCGPKYPVVARRGRSFEI
jgi:hypothetical protein